MAKMFYARVESILKEQKIGYDKKVLVELVTKFFPDYRRTLNELQRYSVGGKIDVGILAQISDLSLNELFDHIKAKKYREIRKWVGIHGDSDQQKLMRDIYDRLSDILKPESVPVAIVLLGKYQYQAAFVVDQEINLMAFLTELMIECEVK